VICPSCLSCIYEVKIFIRIVYYRVNDEHASAQNRRIEAWKLSKFCTDGLERAGNDLISGDAVKRDIDMNDMENERRWRKFTVGWLTWGFKTFFFSFFFLVLFGMGGDGKLC
jgi:hypothetical protein